MINGNQLLGLTCEFSTKRALYNEKYNFLFFYIIFYSFIKKFKYCVAKQNIKILTNQFKLN